MPPDEKDKPVMKIIREHKERAKGGEIKKIDGGRQVFNDSQPDKSKKPEKKGD